MSVGITYTEILLPGTGGSNWGIGLCVLHSENLKNKPIMQPYRSENYIERTVTYIDLEIPTKLINVENYRKNWGSAPSATSILFFTGSIFFSFNEMSIFGICF